MSPLRSFLAGVIVTAAVAVSVLLILRSYPSEPRPTPQVAEVAPPAANASAAQSAPEPAAAPPPVPDPPRPHASAPALTPALEAERRKPENPFDAEALPSPGFIAAPEYPQASLPGSAGQLDTRTSNRPGNARLNLTAEQAARLRYVLLSHSIMQSEAAEFPLRVGGSVPPEVSLTPLPREVADAVPGYSNYSYVISQYQIVIVVTDRREIDFLIPTG